MIHSSFVVVDPSLLNFPFLHPLRNPAIAEFRSQGVDSCPILLAGDAEEGERHRPEAEGDHAPSKPLHDVVIALRCRALKQLNLPAIEARVFVELRSEEHTSELQSLRHL